MNSDNLGVSGAGVGVANDLYGHHHHHHLTHPYLLPPHHSQHPSAIYCNPSNAHSELFSPSFPSDFASADGNAGVPPEYLHLQNPLDYMVSHHPHSQHPHHHLAPPPSSATSQQQQQQQHLHSMSNSSNAERTSSAVGTVLSNSNASPSHSFAPNATYSSSADYYNSSVLNSKATNSTNNNSNSTNNTSGHSPYERTSSTASTSSPPQSNAYLNPTVKQETMMPGAFSLEPHSNYGRGPAEWFAWWFSSRFV